MGRKVLSLLALLVLGLLRIQAFTTERTSQRNSVSPSKVLRSPTAWNFRSEPGFSKTCIFGKKEARAEGNESKRKKERPKKIKDDVIEIEGVVLESLPNAMFRCTIDGAPESQPPILATISGKIRKNLVKILVGDKVLIELSPYDLTRGRITFRYR